MNEIPPIYFNPNTGKNPINERSEARGEREDTNALVADVRRLCTILEAKMGNSNPLTSGDPIVDRVLSRIIDRSKVGQKKYGCTMGRDDLDTLDWIRHAQDESLDLAVYLERLYQDIQFMMDDGR